VNWVHDQRRLHAHCRSRKTKVTRSALKKNYANIFDMLNVNFINRQNNIADYQFKFVKIKLLENIS